MPKGTILNVPVNVLQTDRHVWGDDADEFRPERWLQRAVERKEKEATHAHRELLAFGAGPRMW